MAPMKSNVTRDSGPGAGPRGGFGGLRRFLSTTFSEPLGKRIEPGRVHGYYLDLTVKATDPARPPDGPLPATLCQWGLGAYERHLAGEDEGWLAAAVSCGERLVGEQGHEGGWPHREPMRHTFALDPPWLSALAQGQGASLLVRLHLETGDGAFAEAARRALLPLAVPAGEGGVEARLDGRPFPEEYPTDPPSFVLNGAIFALWGCYDVGVGLGDDAAARAFRDGAAGLAGSLDRWDTGYWSRYDLYPHPLTNVSSAAYHRLHVDQLRALHMLAPHPEFEETAIRFERYRASRVNRARAFAAKAAFRLRVPRR
jgi:heparosan-N-sulfate-glucuronate 5-epimerase